MKLPITSRSRIILARKFLPAYGFKKSVVNFIQHSENLTFRIDPPELDVPFLLRVHWPLVPEFGTHGQDVEMIKSEMAWLQALSDQTGLSVPKPVPNRDGEWVTSLQVPGMGSVNATLLSWLPGFVDAHAVQDESAVRKIGHLVGSLHDFGRRWKRPDFFRRPRWDMPRFWQAFSRLEPLSRDGRLSYQDFQSLRRALEDMETMTAQLANETTFGLLHGDLYRGNFLWYKGQPSLIDFSFCGDGFYLFDLAVCLADLPLPMHAPFLTAYREHMPLPDDYQSLLEGFYIASAISALSIWVNHPESQETLIQRLPVIAQYARDFVNRVNFWRMNGASPAGDGDPF